MGVCSIMGSFGGAIACAKTFSLTQVKFQFNNEQKFKYCGMLKRMKILKQKVKNSAEKLLHKNTSLLELFLPVCFSIFKVSVSVQVLLHERKILARAIVPPNNPIIERAPIFSPVCHCF